MAHVATITIDYTKVPGDLTDYVGLIVPDGSAGYADLYALCLEGGGDIRLFKSDDTTELAREIVSFSVTSETGEIHYKYSGTLSSSVDTDIHVYADGSSSDYAVGATYGRNAVWADYSAVWHMGNSTDSTGNGNTLSAIGGVTIGGATGKFGSATDFDGSDDRVTAADDASLDVLAGDFTLQSWVNPDVVGFQPYMNKGRRSGGRPAYSLDLHSDGQLGFFLQDDLSGFVAPLAGSYSAGAWVQHITTFDRSANGEMYVNATSVATTSITAENGSINTSDTFNIGSRLGSDGSPASYFNGKVSEARLLKSLLSANWITAEYNNQNSYSTFYSVAAVSSSTDYPITAAAGTFALSGVAVTTSWARTIAAAVATFTQTGIALIFARGKGFVATAATFGLSGKAATFAKAISMVTAAGTFALTGIASIGRKTKLLTAAAATFVLTNVDASVSHVRTMAAAAATFALTGIAATGGRAVTLLAAAGTFILSTSITSLLGKVWTRTARSVGEWVRGNKNNDS